MLKFSIILPPGNPHPTKKKNIMGKKEFSSQTVFTQVFFVRKYCDLGVKYKENHFPGSLLENYEIWGSPDCSIITSQVCVCV